jgi:hypothetical protein
MTRCRTGPAGNAGACLQGQAADDFEGFPVTDGALVRERAARGVVVVNLTPDHLAAVPDRNLVDCQPLVGSWHQRFGVVDDRQPVERRAEHEDLPVSFHDGMGHDLPRALWPDITARIAGLVERAEAAAASG